MSDEKYFEKALSNFTYEAASGGAIRHLFDCGYTVSQIEQKLDYPTPLDRIQKTVWEHMIQSGVLKLDEPGSTKVQERVSYVMEFNPYGRRSFRQVRLPDETRAVGLWKERIYTADRLKPLRDCLAELCMQNGEETAYVSWDLGLQIQQNKTEIEQVLKPLNGKQKEYLAGIPWEPRLVYHRLDSRMREIISILHEAGLYHGICYFVKLEEKLIL